MADKKLIFTIDSANIDSDLTDFPVVAQLGQSSGASVGFDSTEVFDELTGGNDSYTKLLIHADEADASTTIADSSDSAHTITAVGDAAVKDFNADGNEIVNYSGHFNGTDGYLTVPDSTDWDIGTDDFTIESWVNFSSYVDRCILGSSADTTNRWMVYTTATQLNFNCTSGGLVNATVTLPVNKWSHIAVVKQSGTIRIYVNGVQENSGANTSNLTTLSNGLEVGARYSTSWGYYAKGYIAGLAYHTGVVLYPDGTTFTPPLTIAEMTNDANTVLFLDFTELDQGDTPATITDSSASAHTVTNVSSKVSGCTFWWSGAVEFDGVDDYLSIVDHADFSLGLTYTIDFWFNPTEELNGNDYAYFFNKRGASGNDVGNSFEFYWYTKDSGTPNAIVYRHYFGTSSAYQVSAGSIMENVWNHIAVVADGIDLYLYVNGVQGDTVSISANAMVDGTHPIEIGGINTANEIQGFMSGIRISKGIARWTTAFTPATKQYKGSWERIHITDASDNELYCEVENWDLTNEKATLHVKVPTISSSADTVLTLDYDSTNADNSAKIGVIGSTPAQNVWDSNFTAVYHMAQDPSGGTDCILDSTSNINHGTPVGTWTAEDLIDADIGKALDFDGTSYITCGNDASMNGMQTAEGYYYNTTGSNADWGALYCRYISNTARWMHIIHSTDSSPYFWNNTVTLRPISDDWGVAEWHGQVYTNTGTAQELFRDGVSQNTGSSTIAVTIADGGDFYLGGYWYNSAITEMLGAVREIRLSNIVRSDDWIATTNLSLTDALVTFTAYSTADGVTDRYIPAFTNFPKSYNINFMNDFRPNCLIRQTRKGFSKAF